MRQQQKAPDSRKSAYAKASVKPTKSKGFDDHIVGWLERLPKATMIVDGLPKGKDMEKNFNDIVEFLVEHAHTEFTRYQGYAHELGKHLVHLKKGESDAVSEIVKITHELSRKIPDFTAIEKDQMGKLVDKYFSCFDIFEAIFDVTLCGGSDRDVYISKKEEVDYDTIVAILSDYGIKGDATYQEIMSIHAKKVDDTENLVKGATYASVASGEPAIDTATSTTSVAAVGQIRGNLKSVTDDVGQIKDDGFSHPKKTARVVNSTQLSTLAHENSNTNVYSVLEDNGDDDEEDVTFVSSSGKETSNQYTHNKNIQESTLKEMDDSQISYDPSGDYDEDVFEESHRDNFTQSGRWLSNDTPVDMMLLAQRSYDSGRLDQIPGFTAIQKSVDAKLQKHDARMKKEIHNHLLKLDEKDEEICTRHDGRYKSHDEYIKKFWKEGLESNNNFLTEMKEMWQKCVEERVKAEVARADVTSAREAITKQFAELQTQMSLASSLLKQVQNAEKDMSHILDEYKAIRQQPRDEVVSNSVPASQEVSNDAVVDENISGQANESTTSTGEDEDIFASAIAPVEGTLIRQSHVHNDPTKMVSIFKLDDHSMKAVWKHSNQELFIADTGQFVLSTTTSGSEWHRVLYPIFNIDSVEYQAETLTPVGETKCLNQASIQSIRTIPKVGEYVLTTDARWSLLVTQNLSPPSLTFQARPVGDTAVMDISIEQIQQISDKVPQFGNVNISTPTRQSHRSFRGCAGNAFRSVPGYRSQDHTPVTPTVQMNQSDTMNSSQGNTRRQQSTPDPTQNFNSPAPFPIHSSPYNNSFRAYALDAHQFVYPYDENAPSGRPSSIFKVRDFSKEKVMARCNQLEIKHGRATNFTDWYDDLVWASRDVNIFSNVRRRLKVSILLMICLNLRNQIA